MEKKGENIKLFSALFPVWFLVLIPSNWIITLPLIFLLSSAVLWIGMKVVNAEEKRLIYKKTIVKIWLFSFLANMIGALILFSNQLVSSNSKFYQLTKAITWNPFDSIIGVLFVSFAVFVAGVCMYWFHKKVSFHAIEIEEKKKKRMALLLAVIMAPYIFFFPTSLLYHQYVGTPDVAPIQDIVK